MIAEYLKKLEQLKGQRKEKQSELKSLNAELKSLIIDLEEYEEAQVIIQQVARMTQQQLEYRVSEIVTLALSAVFEDPYKFEIEFIDKRGKTEAEIWFVRNEEKIKPIDASGGGVVDIASLALRIALWNLQKPKTRNVLILDEPCKCLSADMLDKASLMIKEISQKLGLQIIMVTHSDVLAEAADKVFYVKKKNNVSVCIEG